MTTCDPQDFKYLSSEDNARNNLLKDKVINGSGKILDFKSFDKKAKEFKDYASKLLKIDITSVITGARSGFVKFDKAVFRKVDKVRGYDKINAENIRKQLAALEKPTQEVKPGVEELFESNPELANAVYEAAGFSNPKDTVRLYRIENKNIPYDESREGIVSKKEIIGGFFTDNIDTVSNYIRKNQSQEGINLVYVDVSKSDLDKYHVSKNEYANTMDVESDNWIIPSNINRNYIDLSSVSKVTGNFMTLSKAKQELKSIIDNLPTSQITPQQKQQALQLYQSFLDVYLQDFEQVESVLKEEKIIDKKCS